MLCKYRGVSLLNSKTKVLTINPSSQPKYQRTPEPPAPVCAFSANSNSLQRVTVEVKETVVAAGILLLYSVTGTYPLHLCLFCKDSLLSIVRKLHRLRILPPFSPRLIRRDHRLMKALLVVLVDTLGLTHDSRDQKRRCSPNSVRKAASDNTSSSRYTGTKCPHTLSISVLRLELRRGVT